MRGGGCQDEYDDLEGEGIQQNQMIVDKGREGVKKHENFADVMYMASKPTLGQKLLNLPAYLKVVAWRVAEKWHLKKFST